MAKTDLKFGKKLKNTVLLILMLVIIAAHVQLFVHFPLKRIRFLEKWFD